MGEPKVIKRYANRKLYDTERSCYVTLEDIAMMIRSGDDVVVVDNQSGEDLTKITFAQIILEVEKKQSTTPLGVLKDIIRQGENAIKHSSDALGEFARESVLGVQARANDLKETARETAQRLKEEWEGRIERVIKRKPSDQNNSDKKRSSITELVSASHKALEELQKNVEDRVRGTVGAASEEQLTRDMKDIRKRLNSLEERLEKIPNP